MHTNETDAYFFRFQLSQVAKVGKFNPQRYVQNSARNRPQSGHTNATLPKNQSSTQSNKPVVRLNLTSCDFPSPPTVAAPSQPGSNVAVVTKGNIPMSTNTNLDLWSMEMTTSLLKNQPDWQMYTVETSRVIPHRNVIIINWFVLPDFIVAQGA